MTLTRRRFLTISAACAMVPNTSVAHSWQGRAFGGDVSLRIDAPQGLAKQAITTARRLLREIEGLFNLYDTGSALSRLNEAGQLLAPDPRFVTLMRLADHGHHMTGGRFDPTIQPLWRAMAEGRNTNAAQAAIGWNRVTVSQDQIRLAPNQALTFNGIAQGYATDVVAVALQDMGLTHVLVNLGEFRGIGGPFQLGLSDPAAEYLGNVTLSDGAIATSSPGALAIGGDRHILHPTFRPQWSTVSVEAETAALADCLSTALCLADRGVVEKVRDQPGVRRIFLVDFNGNLTTL